MKKLLITVLLSTFLAGTSYAEEIVLESGKVIKGDIRGQKDGILELQQPDGSIIFINVVKIAAIRRSPKIAGEPETDKPVDKAVDSHVISEKDRLRNRIDDLQAELDKLRNTPASTTTSGATVTTTVDTSELEAQIAELKKDIESLKSDMEGSEDIVDRISAVDRRIDSIKSHSAKETGKLRDDLNKNSSELLKLVLEVAELKKNMELNSTKTPELGAETLKKIETMRVEMKALRNKISGEQKVLSDIRDIKIQNKQLASDIRQMQVQMQKSNVARREQIQAEIERITGVRIRELEAKNVELVDDVNKMRNLELNSLRAEISNLQTQLQKMASYTGPVDAPGTVLKLNAHKARATGGKLLKPWTHDFYRVTGADAPPDSSLAREPVYLSDDQVRRWLKSARNASALAEESFQSAARAQQGGDVAAAAKGYRTSLKWFTLAIERFARVNRAGHLAECEKKLLALEKRIQFSKDRIRYLKK